jgi:hypothetical protein
MVVHAHVRAGSGRRERREVTSKRALQPDELFSGRGVTNGTILEGAFKHVEVGDLEWS